MRVYQKLIPFALAALLAAPFELVLPHTSAFAQTNPSAATSVSLTEATVKALQEALNKQGISVNVSGILNDETRAAVKKYQTQHHLPTTGEPDKATLDKLGVQISAAPASSGTIAQAMPTAPSASASQTNAMNCPMMQGQMGAMMQMMQGMMDMMKTMQGQMMQPGQMMPGSMPGQMQPGQMQPPSR